MGLVNVLCRILAYVKTVTEYRYGISRKCEQISKHRGYRNAHAVSTLMRLVLIDGLGYFTVVLTRLLADR